MTLLAVFLFALTPAAPPLSGHYYLDPGSGSFILQVLLATLLASLFLLKTFWSRIIGFFRKSSPKENNQQDDEQE